MELITILLRIILLYAIIVGGSIFIACKTNKKIEHCIAINFGLIILSLYIFGLFEILKYGVWVISTLNIILGIYTIIKNWKNQESLKKTILTPGFAFFSIIFFILLMVSYNKNLVDYDHYFYRSFNTKVLYYTDSMSRGYTALYPPAINLLEYFFMKIIGQYIQGIEAFAVQMLGFSFLIPLFDRKIKSNFMNLVIILVLICMPAILPNLIFYESAYPDALIGLIIGYIMYILYAQEDNKFKILSISTALLLLTITKPAGFYISAIIIAMYLLIEILNSKCNKKENIVKFLKSKELKNIIILVIVVVSIFASWKIFTKVNNKYNIGTRGGNATRVEGNPIAYTLKNIFTTTFGYYEENHEAADSNNKLIPAIYSIYTTTAPVRLTAYGVIMVIILAGVLVYKKVIMQENKKKFANYIIALTIGLVVYIMFLQLSYILKFSTKEMLGHNGLNRYLPTFLLGMIYFIIAIAIKNMEEKHARKVNYIILLVIIISFTHMQSIANVSITSGISNINSIEYCNNGRIPAKKINEKIENEARVITISQEDKTNIFNWMIKYYLYPEHHVDVYNQVKEKQVESIKQKMTEGEENYYLYFVSVDEELNKLINKHFDAQIKLEKETLYKVENKVELTKIPLD